MILVALVFGGREQPGGAGTYASTYSHTPGGMLAVYRFLSRRAEPVPERWELPWSALEGTGNLLIVAGPLRAGPTDQEAQALMTWVGRGNTLVYLVGRDRAVDARADESRALEAALNLKPDRPVASDGGADILAAARGVAPQLLSLAPAVPAPATLGIDYVVSYTDRGLTRSRPALPLLEQPDGTVHLCRWPEGRGAVYVGSSSSLFCNELIEKEGNFLLLLNLLATAGEDRVLFDEFHHGYTERPALTTPYSRGVLAALVAQMILVGTMFLVSRGRRFGPVLRPRPRGRRGGMEFVDALAELYRRGRAGGYVLEQLYDDFRERAGRELRLGRRADTRQLAAAVSARTGRSLQSVQDDLNELERAATGKRVSSRRVLRISRKLAQLAREVLAP